MVDSIQGYIFVFIFFRKYQFEMEAMVQKNREEKNCFTVCEKTELVCES